MISYMIITKWLPKDSLKLLSLQALVKEPALSDGRLQPGDKLLAANGVELASFSHQEVITMNIMMKMIMTMVMMRGRPLAAACQ